MAPSRMTVTFNMSWGLGSREGFLLNMYMLNIEFYCSVDQIHNSIGCLGTRLSIDLHRNEMKGTHFSSSNDGSLARLEDYTFPPFLALWMRESNGLLIAERGV